MFNFQKIFLLFLCLSISSPVYAMQNWSNSLHNILALIYNVFIPSTKKIIVEPFWHVYTTLKLNKYSYTRNQHIHNIKSSFRNTLKKELQEYIKKKEPEYIQSSFRDVVMKELQENSSGKYMKQIEKFLENGANSDCEIQFPGDTSFTSSSNMFYYCRSNNTTPLVAAIENSNLALVKILLKYHANVNVNVNIENYESRSYRSSIKAFIFPFNHLSYLKPIKQIGNKDTWLEIIDNLLEDGADLKKVDSYDNNIFHIFNELYTAPEIRERVLIHANFNDEKKLHHKIKTVLCIFKRFNFNNKDIHFRIFSYLPDYFNHRGLYSNLFAQNYMLQPYSLFQIAMRLEQFTNMLQQTNKTGETPLDKWSYSPEELEKHRPDFSKNKFQKDFDAFKKAYNTILSNSAFDKTTKSESELDLLLLPSLQLEFDIQNNNIAYKMFKYSVLKKHPSLLASNETNEQNTSKN